MCAVTGLALAQKLRWALVSPCRSNRADAKTSKWHLGELVDASSSAVESCGMTRSWFWPGTPGWSRIVEKKGVARPFALSILLLALNSRLESWPWLRPFDLISRGYFPRELPPPFTTEAFGAFVSDTANRQTLPAQKEWTRCVLHNLARPGSLRRQLRIPNPIHHLPLAEEIEQKWPLFVKHFRSAGLSASSPLVRRTILDRAIVPRLSHRDLSRLRARRFVGARYFLHTDISQFYPSIYTHSLPWAIHGKSYAKSHMNKTAADSIDRALRAQQEGQTIGIPIGPDSSLVVAEAILTSVDAKLTHLKPSGFRYVDDYEIGFGSLAEAEEMLTELQGLLAEYELHLNPRKTSIIEGPIPLDEDWVIELGRFAFRDSTPVRQLNDAISFSRAVRPAEEASTTSCP